MSEQNQQFDVYNEWVNQGQRWLTAHWNYGDHFKAICIDSHGRICRIGANFKRAADDGAFPVRWWWPDQTIDELDTTKTKPLQDNWQHNRIHTRC